MKILKTITYSFLTATLLFSCSSEDDSSSEEPNNPVTSTNQAIVIEDTSYTLDKGIYEDYGVQTDFLDTAYYNADIYISDGEIAELNEAGETYSEFDEDSEIIFATDFYSSTSENIEFGTYDIVTFENVDNNEVTDKFALDTYIDIYDAENEFTYEATSGTITFVDNGNNNYTVTVDGVFEKFIEDELSASVTGVNIAFTFTGDFLYSDQRD